MPRKGSDISPIWHDPDDAPEWTEDQLERAELRRGGQVVRPADGAFTRVGRPRSVHPKRQVTLRLDPDIIDHFQSSGPGWQTRINDFLRKAVEA